MNRVLMAALAAALVATAGLAEDKAEVKPVRDQFQEIIKDYQTAQRPLIAEFQNAKTEEEKEAVIAKLPALAKPFGEKAVKLASDNPKDPAAIQCLMFALQAAQNEQAGQKLLEMQSDPKVLARTCMQLASAATNPAAEKFLKSAMAQSKDKTVQGSACLALAQMMFAKSDTADIKSAPMLSKAAEDFAVRASKDYGDVEGVQGKIGEQAERILFQIRNLGVGKKAPEVVSRDLAEKETKLSALKGKVVILDIWATWCGPCVAMIPHEREMVDKFKGKPFVLVSISADEKKETLENFLKEKEMPWTHWWEGRRPTGILKDWNVTFFPTIYVLDANGVIRHKNIRGKKLEEAVEKLIQEAEKKS